MLTDSELIKVLEITEDPAAQRRLIEQEASRLTESVIQQMKSRANDLLRTDIPKGLALADNIRYASEVSGRPIFNALSLMVQANALRRKGQEREAIALYDRAQAIALAELNPVEAARSQVGKIGALMQLSEYQAAIELSHQTAETLFQHAEVVSGAIALMNAANCYNQIVQPEKALEEYKKAQNWLETISTPQATKQLALVLFNIAVTMTDMGRYYEALDYFHQAISIARRYNLTLDEALFQLAAAFNYFLLGDYNRALRIFRECREKFDLKNTPLYLINAVRNIADCYIEMGRYEEAEVEIRNVLGFLEELNKTKDTQGLRTYIYLSRILTLLERTDEALEAVQQALSIEERIGKVVFGSQLLLRKVELYLLRNEAEKAVETLNLIFSENYHENFVPQGHLLLARAQLQMDNYEAAITAIQQAISGFEKSESRSGLAESYYRLAEIFEKRGKLAEAFSQLQKSLKYLEQLRGRIAAEIRGQFLRSRGVVYESAIALALETEQVSVAFNLAERVKSRALVEMVGQQLDVRVKVRAEADRPIVEEIEQLRRRHNELTGKLALWKPDDKTAPLSPEERISVQKQVLEVEKRLAVLTEHLQVRNALYAEDATLSSNYQDFDYSVLEPHRALVEYFCVRGEVLAFIVTRQGTQVVRNLTTQRNLVTQLQFFRLNLGGTVKNLADAATLAAGDFEKRLQAMTGHSQAMLGKLYNLLFAPLEPFLQAQGCQSLVIVPHSTLHYLPFHALYNAKTQQYLVETFAEISYLPSASLLNICRERAQHPRGQNALVVGFSNQGALPSTLEEAQLVAATLGCPPAIEEAATLAQFRNAAASRQIIHLATHGRYREDAPLFSSLLLADGELTAHEIFNMEWQASLVTLSACDSGLNTVMGGGDELVGLSRACLYAGASSLALALWRVEDRAGTLLMQQFYRNLLNGETKAQALRQAQLFLLQNPLYRHPFYWAPFILMGDNGKL